jgi:chromosome partitioning protein
VKLISTLNFKGGVGKTTVTWLLARYLVERRGKNVLVMDTDPQMSLTTAVELLEEQGVWDVRFENWHKEARVRGATLYRLLIQYSGSGDISIKESPFYMHRPNLYLLPSDEEIYWYDLEGPKLQGMSGFMGRMIEEIKKAGDLPQFHYCIADCPPAFNSLSFSVVSHSDLVLIPINPDVFASRGVSIMLSGLRKRLKSLPPFLVFMNRARSTIDRITGQPKLTRESADFLNGVAAAVELESRHGTSIKLLRDVFIPERKGIKDALAARRRIPPDLETYFAELCDEIEAEYFAERVEPKVEKMAPNALREEYGKLIMQFGTVGRKAVQEFVQEHASGYLDEFIKLNSLPIPTKASKQAIEEGLISCLAQRKAITDQDRDKLGNA